MQERIEIAAELIFENNPQLTDTKRELKQIFNFVTSCTHFIFNGSIYDQIDGVSMGSPLRPVLANLFMGYHEKKCCKNLAKERFSCINVMLMISFVCLEMKSMQKISFNFLTVSIKISNLLLKKKAMKFLSFLHILIKHEGSRFSTSVYRKKISIGLFTQFDSFTAISYKIGLVRCFIHRAFKISSSYIPFHNEVEKVKILLEKNMYPKTVIDNQIKTFLDKQYKVDSGTTSEKQKNITL